MLQSVGSRLSGHPRFVVCRRFVVESALAEANSFLSECQPFCNIARERISWQVVGTVRDGCGGCEAFGRRAPAGPGQV